MKKARVLFAYFSQSGTTKKVAEQIADGFSASGWETVFHDINDGPVKDVKAYDIIGIGTPTYYFRPPFHVTDFLSSFPGLEGKSSFVFVMRGTTQGDAGNIIRRRLKNLHANDLGYFHCGGADLYLGYIKRGFLFSPDSPDDKELNAVSEFGKTICQRYESSNVQAEPYDKPAAPIYKIERFLTNRAFTKYLYSKFFRVDTNCNACGICIKNCPTGNILKTDDGFPVWRSNCLLCGYCSLNCPADAVHSPFDWAIFAPFMNINISKSCNASIPCVKVEQKAGKIIKVNA
jgi:flavodoxin/Fe-S-cluster-containing hydrogenase component 2